MRLTEEQAAKLGLIDTHAKDRRAGKSKREKICEKLQAINAANVSMAKTDNGYHINIEGVTAPSWNEVLRWDLKREFASYNKAWHKRMYDAALEHQLHRERSKARFHVVVTVYRPRLLDYDNICVKQIIDSICKCGLIYDDNPDFIAGYTVTQQQRSLPGVEINLNIDPQT